MKKFLPRIAAAVIIALGCILLLDHIFMPKYINENLDGRITGEFYTQAKDPDVIFLGASTVHYCISPDRLWQVSGITSYDRSNASQTMWQSHYMLKDTLAFTKPDLVALDVSFIKNGAEFVEEPSNRKVIDHMRDPASKLGAVLSSAGDFEEPVSYFLPVLRYHTRWKELGWDDVRYAFASPDVTYDGFIMDFSIPREQHIYEPESIGEFSFPPKALEYLDRIEELCKKEGIALLLMKTPTFVNSWHEEYDGYLAERARDKGISYVNFADYADEMGLEVRYDYIDDGEHTNVVGAHKFTDYLGEYLRREYELPDRRTEKDTSDLWNKKCERYEAALGEGMEEYNRLRMEIDRL